VADFELIRLAFDEVEASPGFAPWLAAEQVSIALTKGNGLCFIGLRPDGSLALTECQYGHCTALAAAGSQTLLLASRYQVWRLENALAPGELTDDQHDRLYLPQTAWTTGALNIRDVAFRDDGQIVFVNGLFSCLCTVSDRLNFEPIWLPPFVSTLAAEDRCHLSGVALVEGKPAYVTCASRSDVVAGWRDEQRGGGVIVSVADGETLASGLSMPCSPVVRDGRIWFCDGGAGELCAIELAGGEVERVVALPGFARGLALAGDWAIVGVSRPLRGATFSGLPLADRLAADQTAPRCGLAVVDLRTGVVEHTLFFAGGSPEIQALAVLLGVRSATSIAFIGDDAQDLVTVPRTKQIDDRRVQ
jgi:uncharacterized protein (TIGR03032 family)